MATSKKANKTKTKRVAKKQKSAFDKMQTMRTELNGIFVERESVVDGILVAILACVHMALLGPRGTGKTAVLKTLFRAIVGASVFKKQLNKFSEPNDIFGPMHLGEFKKGNHRRNVGGMVPEANFVYFDEVFKANGSILDAMLDLLEDREYNNGGELIDCPLVSCFGSSNELPSSIGEDKAPLWDRFPVRFWIDDVRDLDKLKEVLMAGGSRGRGLSDKLSLDDIFEMQEEVEAVEVSEEVVDTLTKLRKPLQVEAEVKVSTRTWCKCLDILRAVAYLEGRTEVTEDDLLFLQNVLWDEPTQKGKVAKVVAQVANPLAHKAQQILDAATTTYRGIDFDKQVDPADSADTFTQAVEANGSIQAGIDRLKKDANGRKSAAVEAVVTEMERMVDEIGRYAAKVSGLRIS